MGSNSSSGRKSMTAPRVPHSQLPTAPSALGWVKCREHISLLIILCIIVYVTNKAHLSLICIICILCERLHKNRDVYFISEYYSNIFTLLLIFVGSLATAASTNELFCPLGCCGFYSDPMDERHVQVGNGNGECSLKQMQLLVNGF